MNATPRLAYNLANVSFSVLERWGESVVVVSVEGVKFFVGAHLAELLRRETFNLYSSLKRRNIPVRQTDQMFLQWLVGHQLIYPGTTSVTLVGVDDVQGFVDDCVIQNEQRAAKRAGAKRERGSESEMLDIQASAKEPQFVYCGVLIDLLEADQQAESSQESRFL